MAKEYVEDERRIKQFMKSAIQVMDDTASDLYLLKIAYEGHYTGDRLSRFKEDMENAWKQARTRLNSMIETARFEDEKLKQNGLTAYELSLKLKFFYYLKERFDSLHEKLKEFKGREEKFTSRSQERLLPLVKHYRSIIVNILKLLATLAGSIPGLEFLNELSDIWARILTIRKDYDKL